MLIGSIRPRGLSEEAGHMALFYEFALPLSFLYLRTKPLLFQISCCAPIFSAYVLLGSAASFLALPIAILVSALVNIRSKKSLIIVLVLSILCVIMLSSEVSQDYINNTVGIRFTTLINPAEGSNSSALDRNERYSNALLIAFNAPLGIGWGASSQLAVDGQSISGITLENAGLVSLYAEILVATGVLGLFLFFKIYWEKAIWVGETQRRRC